MDAASVGWNRSTDVGWVRAGHFQAAGIAHQVNAGERASTTPRQRRPTGRRSPPARQPHPETDPGGARWMRRPWDGRRIPVGRRCAVRDSRSAVLVTSRSMRAAVTMVRSGPPYTWNRSTDVGWVRAGHFLAAGIAQQVNAGERASTTPRQRRPTGRRSPPARQPHRETDPGVRGMEPLHGRRVGQSGPFPSGRNCPTSQRRGTSQHHSEAAAAHRETVTTGKAAAS